MAWAAIRTEITSILSGLNAVGMVHDRLRLILNDSTLRSVGIEANNIINLWMHERISFEQEYLTNTEKLVRHQWMIRGYYSFDDSLNTAHTFQTIVEAIQNAFDADPELNGTAELVELVEWRENETPHVFIPPGDGGKLCHTADLRLIVHERLVRS